MKKLIPILFLLAASAVAQVTNVKSICFTDGTGTPTNNCITANGFTKMNPTGIFAPLGSFDNSAASHTISAKVGLAANKPGTCSDGEEYFATDAFLGQNKFYCVGNTWQQARTQFQILSNTGNTYSAGAKQIFVPSATTAGMELSCVTADPSVLIAGDLWCRSDQKLIKFYDGTTTQSFAIGGNFVPAGVDANSSGQVTGLHLATTRSGDVVYYNGTIWTHVNGNNNGATNTLWPLMEGPTGVPAWSTNLSENTATNTLNYSGPGGVIAPTVYATQNVGAGTLPSNCNVTNMVGCIGATAGAVQVVPTAGQGALRYDSTTSLWRIQHETNGENYAPENTNTGNAGQVPVANGDGTFTVADPAISVNTMPLFTNQSATGTATSTAVTNPLRSNAGQLVIVWASITGSPSGCTVTLSGNQSASGTTDSGTITSVSVTPSNGYSNNQVIPTINGLKQQADNMVAVYSCSVYPSTGTFSMTFNPAMPIFALGTTPVNTTQVGGNNVVTNANGLQGVAIMSASGKSATQTLNASSSSTPVPTAMSATGGISTGGGQTQVYCDKTVIKNNFSTNGSTQIIAAFGGSPGQNEYICGFVVNSASTTAVTVKLVAGTHTTTDCDTNTTDMSIAVPLQATANNAPVGQNVTPPSNGFWSSTALGVPTNSQVCVNLSAAQAVNLQVWYAQGAF